MLKTATTSVEKYLRQRCREVKKRSGTVRVVPNDPVIPFGFLVGLSHAVIATVSLCAGGAGPFDKLRLVNGRTRAPSSFHSARNRAVSMFWTYVALTCTVVVFAIFGNAKQARVNQSTK
ncbi:MAG: hypothetical protein MPJ50_10095 [Pirellulales bacterium]|nr:hypothetical protein [Pirellulales bacterium]